MTSKASLSKSEQAIWKGTRRVRSVARKIPDGMLLHHNHVRHGPGWSTGINGFRAWFSPHKFPGSVQCPCGWMGLKHYADRGYVKSFREHPMRHKRWVNAEMRRWLAPE
jgi:hypothetical protein